MYVCVCTHSFLSYLLLIGHHHFTCMVVMAILSSYSYSSGNQLRVVAAIFPLYALILYRAFCPKIKKKRNAKKRKCTTTIGQ